MQEQEVLEEIEEIERALGEISRRQAAREEQEQIPPLPQGETEAPPAPPEQDEPPEQAGTTIIHIYVVDAPPSPPEEDERTIESTLEAAEEEEDSTGESEHEPPLLVTHPLSLRGRRIRVPFLLLALCLFVGGAMFFVSLVPLFTASATVTIIPTALEISTTTAVTLVTGTSHPGSVQVAGRRLSTLTLSQEQVTPTTGTGHKQAQAAHGLITFYNALPGAQTVPVGTLLVGADGVQVVTEADANIPAGTLSTNGQVSVTAHALEMGPAGNIRANDLYGPCCRANVFAQNPTAFHGGQNARDFPMVRAEDRAGAVTTLKASLQASVQAALLTQVRPDETLITPVPCAPKVSANHAVGEEATQLRVRLDETCTGETYDTQAVLSLLTKALTQEAARQAGPGYTLTGAVQVTGVSVTPSLAKDHQQHEGMLMLHVRGVGTWAYQFSDEQLRHMAQLIADKSREQATTLLFAQRGVSQVAMTVSGIEQTRLPADTSRIHLLVLSRSS